MFNRTPPQLTCPHAISTNHIHNISIPVGGKHIRGAQYRVSNCTSGIPSVQCYATPTDRHNSMAADRNYMCFRHFVSEMNRLVLSSTSCGVDMLMTL